MLLSQTFTHLLHESDRGNIIVPAGLDQNRVLITLLQVLTRILQTQEEDGSWTHKSCEVTAYSILALANIWQVPWSSPLRLQIAISIENGHAFFVRRLTQWEAPSYVWIEKTLYSSPVLSKTYCIAAVHAASNYRSWSLEWSEKMQQLVGDSTGRIKKTSAFLSSLPLFREEQRWRLTTSVLEGSLHIPAMLCAELAIFPKAARADHEYLEFIPMTWTCSNAIRALPLEANVVWDMILTSLLVFQADEYMETMVDAQPDDILSCIRSAISRICAEEEAKSTMEQDTAREIRNGSIKRPRLEAASSDTSNDSAGLLSEIEQTLSKFVNFFTSHRRVVESPSSVQSRLRNELKIFLHAHIDQIQDSRRFASSKSLSFESPRSSYYEWVHTTSANHTSCPFAFVFFSCLAGHPGG